MVEQHLPWYIAASVNELAWDWGEGGHAPDVSIIADVDGRWVATADEAHAAFVVSAANRTQDYLVALENVAGAAVRLIGAEAPQELRYWPVGLQLDILREAVDEMRHWADNVPGLHEERKNDTP